MSSQVSTDPIADMLSRIRNAVAINKHEVVLPHSNIKEEISKILKNANFINNVTIDKKTKFKEIHLELSSEDQNSKITEIVRLSKPGRRTYVKAKEIPTVKQGRGIVIISTSKGIMSGERAKQSQIGGELICKVY
jgi:small subunit ribosomal protein S8